MAEYRYVELPRSGAWKAEDREANINADLEALASEGWEPVSVSKPAIIAPVGFLLRKG